MKIHKLLLLVVLLTAYWGCGEKKYGPEDDTPTSGTIKISVDESFKPIIQSEVSTFESIYKYAHINASYVPETQAIQDLLNDSARIVIVTRDLNDKEKKYFEGLKIIPHSLKVAYDGVALIINNQNDDSLVTSDEVRKIFRGDITNWKQLKGKTGNNNIQLVFDNSASGTVRFMKDFAGSNELAKNSFALNNNEAVIDYISKNKNAIGIIGVGWISDTEDSTSNSFLSKIRVMEIAPDDTSKGAGSYYKPYQAYIAQKFYPLWRTVYIVSRESRSGLGTGFSGFIAGEKGQRIILKSGLVPATMPVRLVEIRNQNFNITK